GGFFEAVAGGALGDTRGFTAAAAQIVELGAADRTTADQLDAVDPRAEKREYPLDAFAIADFANGEAGIDAGTAAGDADAFISLDPLTVAFTDAYIDDNRITGGEGRNLAVLLKLLQLLGFKFL